MSKLKKMQRFIPSLYRPDANPYVKGLLTTWADEDDRLVQAVQDAKEQIFVKYAQLQYLDALGSNVGVFRPAAINLSDEQYRDLIPALSWNPKQVKPTIRKVLDVFFGQNNPLVQILELNPNEIVIQIPSSVPALRRDLRGANHFKTYSGTINAIDNILKTMNVTLDSQSKSVVYTDVSQSNPNAPTISPSLIVGDSRGQSFTAPQDFTLTSFQASISRDITVSAGFFTWQILGFTGGVPDPAKVFWERNYPYSNFAIGTPSLETFDVGSLDLYSGEQYIIALKNNTNNLIYTGIDSVNGFVSGSAWNLAGAGPTITTFSQPSGGNLLVLFNPFSFTGDVGDKVAQQWTAPTDGSVSDLRLRLYSGSIATVGQYKISIQADNGANRPDGVDLGSMILNANTLGNTLPPTFDTYTLTSPAPVLSGQKYWVVFEVVVQADQPLLVLAETSVGAIPELFVDQYSGSWIERPTFDLVFEVDVEGPSGWIAAGTQDFGDFEIVGKATTVTNLPSTKSLVSDEWATAAFGQGLNVIEIVGNDAGNTNVEVQFNLSADLSAFTQGERFMVAGVPKYQGAFIPNPDQAFTVTKQRGVLGQNIVAGQLYPTLIMQDASGIPDAPGRIVFNYGRKGEEADIRYYGRPNNTTLLIDPSYNFLRDHSIGEAVNVIVKPYQEPRTDGYDYSVYLVGVIAARVLAQQIVESVAASGVVVRWVVVEPVCVS